MKTTLDRGIEPRGVRGEEYVRTGQTRAESGAQKAPEDERNRVGRRMVALGIGALAFLTAFQMYSTWATWGNLSIDAGHETYVPWVLSEGQMLYRDVWYHYGPA